MKDEPRTLSDDLRELIRILIRAGMRPRPPAKDPKPSPTGGAR